MDMLLPIVLDGLFAAMAAIGFAAISNPPLHAFKYCALIAAVGHALRFVLIGCGVHIIPAAFAGAVAVGMLAVLFAPCAKCPPETFSFPALLPMIPGMYACRTVEGLVMCLMNQEEQAFNHYFYLFSYNGMMCTFIVMAMVVGITVPIFIFKGMSFSATKL